MKVFDFVNAYQQRVQQLEEIKSEHEPEVVTQYKIKSETSKDIQDQMKSIDFWWKAIMT